MCGFTGIFTPKGKYIIEKKQLDDMLQKIVHRGPDENGFHLENKFGVGFCRLSILDLSGGKQPMYNETKSLISVCNGEIFNYQELKEELIQKGHQFKSQCDVEVLVHLYEEYGKDFISRLNGQFAFAIYDREKEELLLARDQVGIVPLFYHSSDKALIFGSEIKALLPHPLVQRKVDLTGLDQVMTLPGLVSPRTMFEGIEALPPGHLLVARKGKVEIQQYWDLQYPTEAAGQPPKSPAHYMEQLDELMKQSVNYRLLADVPVGFYLSGGLDSSLIASYVHALKPDLQRHSFSIVFADNAIDERVYQRDVAGRVNSLHHEIEFSQDKLVQWFRSMILHGEAPVKESYNTCSLALSQAVREQDVKVILTGEGADELFAGYLGYRLGSRSQENSAQSISMIQERELRQQLWGDPDFFYEKNYLEFQDTKKMLFSEGLNQQFINFNCLQKPLLDKSKIAGRHHIHQRSYLDFKLRMADHLLADHGDRVAYANSIEARYPFLDINLIEFVTTLPPSLLVYQGQEKFILKLLAARYLPTSITKREKFAFVAPSSAQLLRLNLPWVQDTLSYARIKRQGYFNPDVIERLKKRYADPNFTLSQTFENDLLMIVLSFGLFLEIFDLPDFS